MASQKPDRNIQFAFDVGHSSIGWAVLQADAGKAPQLLGTGTVIFPTDDCLASERRRFRRQRRHIRAIRLRIARLRRLLSHLRVLTPPQLDDPGCAWPWLLAARTLRGGKSLTWPELWDVLRWYSHNRGYDGNRGWSRHETKSVDDTEKEQRAHELLQRFQQKHERPGTMAEVFCDALGIDPLGEKKSSIFRVRNLGAAFPREGVEAEVERILRAHCHVLPAVDEAFIEAVMRDHTAVAGPAYRIPARFGQRLASGAISPGGVLFGQLIPRFDNRIINRCPITFERVYQRVKAEGGGEERAAREAEKLAKVPAVDCIEFYRFRWVMQLANVKIAVRDGRSPRNLGPAERSTVNEKMERQGFLTPKQFRDAVRALTDGAKDNLDQMLLHPDAKRALVLDPVREFLHSNALASAMWPALSVEFQKRLIGGWRRGRTVTVGSILQLCPAIEPHLLRYLDAQNTKTQKKGEPLTWANLLTHRLSVHPANGRAPFAREVMREVIAYVLGTDRHPAEEGGPLFRTEAIRRAQLQRPVDEQTNNHLVRHRLKLVERLHDDLIAHFAEKKADRVARITVEVNRDLREMSGKTAQEQAKEQGQQLAHFKGVVRKLKAAYKGLGIRVGPGLIRKGRIAEDLGWSCPYTGKSFDALDLLHGGVDKDHIIPRTLRPSDSLDSLVMTFTKVNEWKAKRTAYQFVAEEQGKPVPGLPQLTIKTLTRYLADVKALDERRGHDDDLHRKRKRKTLLQLRDYVEREFTPGDLTQTSQLVRLAAQVLQKRYAGVEAPPVITSLPGSVTGAVRKSWNLTGCLAAANPLVLDPDDLDDDRRPRVRTKTEIRSITHLHHALDACVLAFASYFLPRDGGAWELLVKRRLDSNEQRRARELFGAQIEISQDGQLRLAQLPSSLKSQICDRLKERRVVQHLPSDLSSLRCKETVWRIFDPADTHPNSRRIARWLAARKIRVPPPDAATALIICRKRKKSEATGDDAGGGKVFRDDGKTWRWVYDIKDKSALLGLSPEGDVGAAKLKRIKAVKVLGENFGLSLDPEPTLIRPHKIWHQLTTLKKANGDQTPRLLRKGVLVRVPPGGNRPQYEGLWMVRGITLNQRSGFLVDLSPADQIIYRRQSGSRENVSVATLLRCGLQVIKSPLCGVAARESLNT